jgi:hypothetical protein
VLGPVDGLLDLERPLLGGACRLKLPDLLLEDAEVAERGRHVGVLGLIDGLLDLVRPLLGRACRLKLPELVLNDAEVSQRDRDREVLGPPDRLEGRERALQQLPRARELPARLLISVMKEGSLSLVAK